MHKLHNVKASAPRGPVLGVILLIWVLVTGPQAEYSLILADYIIYEGTAQIVIYSVNCV